MRKTVRSSHSLTSIQQSIVLILLFSIIGYSALPSHSIASNLTIAPGSLAAVDGEIAGPRKGKRFGSQNECPRCAPVGDHEIYIPLIDLPEARGGELVFNSRSPKEMAVTPTFYKRDGTAISGEPMVIQSAEIRYVNIKKLIPERFRDQRDWGGLSLSYHAVPREMWAQFRLLGVNDGGNVDEFFTVKADQRSEIQEAVWWMPRHSTAIIALGNITDSPTSAIVNFGSGDTQTISLGPRATEVIRHQNGDEDNIESISINITGAAGSVIPTGLIASRESSFNSTIRFYDTKRTRQPHLFANGLRLEEITPHMILKNTSSGYIKAQPEFITLAGSEAVKPIVLPEISLGPRESTEVDLTPILLAAVNRDDLRTVSVRVSNSGQAGSLIGALYGTDRTSGVNYETPLRDSGPVRSMTGSYPWKVTNDYSTIVYITNISDQKADIAGEINYSGGKVFLEPRTLAPGETKVFDLRQIRDERIADSAGHIVPKWISQGQFKWAVRGVTNGKLLLIGRAEMVSHSQQISTSYSCNDPCPPYYDGWLSPFPPPVIMVSTTGDSSAWEQMTYDWGYTVGPYAVSAAWSLDKSIGTLAPDSGHSTLLTGTTPGTAMFEGFIGVFQDFVWDGLNCYELGTYETGGEEPVEVPPTVAKIQYQSDSSFVDISGTLYVLKGSSVTFKAIPDPANGTFPNGQPVWSGSSGASGTGDTVSVTFNSKSSSTTNYKTVKATSGNEVTVDVVVYELTAILTPQDNFSGRSLALFGVAERVNLSFTADPAVTATQAGGLLWKQTTGTGNLTGTTNGTGTYIAAASPESVTLKLEIQAGPSKTLGPSSSIGIIAPSGAYQIQDPGTGIKHVFNTCSAGFKARTFLEPRTVSFINIEVREGSTSSVATGWLSPSNGTNHPAGIWLPVANCTFTAGCQIQSIDTIYGEQAPFFGGPMWGNGSFTWNIPREWRVIGAATQFTTLQHLYLSDSRGRATISKGGAGPFSKNAADPTSSY